MEKKIKGKAYVCGRDDVDTDMIIPAKYLNTHDPKELAQHAMEFIDPRFPEKAKKMGIRIVVGGKNFGCGSSREHAPISIKTAGVSCVIAKTFARIFFRNSINIGLLIVEQPQAAEEINEGDEVEVSMEAAKITNLTSGKEYSFAPLPEEIQKIVGLGGLMNFVKTQAS